MSGVPKNVRINGISFVFPSDCAPTVHSGGRQFTEGQLFSDNSSEGKEDVTFCGIKGLQVKCPVDKWNQLNKMKGKKNLPIVYEASDRVCEFTGYIVCSDGLNYDSVKEITNEFELHSQAGTMNDTALS